MKQTIDARGLTCPQPVIEAKQALKSMGGGELEVLVDNQFAVQNLTKLGAYLKVSVMSEKMSEKEFRVVYQTNQQGDEGKIQTAVISEQNCQQDIRKKGTVVVLSSEYMGEGSQELGAILMKGFLYALTELDEIPETILLYNGGAKLSVEGSQSLEDLKLLESQGATIMTCGTCLNHYGLSEKLSVGSVTNMYVIAEVMMQAALLMKP